MTDARDQAGRGAATIFEVDQHVRMVTGRTGVIVEIYAKSERPFAWIRTDGAVHERAAAYLDELVKL
jgi:hypothetical protein